MTLKDAVREIAGRYDINIEAAERVLEIICLLTGEDSNNCSNAHNIIRISLALHCGRLDDEIFTASETLWLMQNGNRVLEMVGQAKERIGAL